MLIRVNLFLGKVFNYGEESSKKGAPMKDVCTEVEGVKSTQDLQTNGEIFCGQRGRGKEFPTFCERRMWKPH